mgnify:CR=1 FL=1
MKVYFWLKQHGWRIAYWALLVMAFISAYNGDTWQDRVIHAVLNTFGVWGVMIVGEFASLEKLNEQK